MTNYSSKNTSIFNQKHELLIFVLMELNYGWTLLHSMVFLVFFISCKLFAYELVSGSSGDCIT